MSIPSYRHILETFITQSDGKHIINHQLESFNQFMEVDIPEIIHMSNPITSYGSPEIPLAGPRSALATATGLSTTAANALMGTLADGTSSFGRKVQHEYEVTLDFEKISIRKPTIFENNGAIHPMMPNDARLRNLTYASPLNVDVKVTTTFIDNSRNGIRESNVRIFPNVHLGKIPVMVGSKYCLLNDQKHYHPSALGECPEDVGGYFIIQGGERVMISMERMSENRPFVFRNGRGNSKDMEVVEIKCIGPDNDQVPKSNTIKIVYHPKNQLITMLRATIPRIKTEIPLMILFRALGVLADRDIYELIVGYENDPSYDPIITESILEASSIKTREQALTWLGEHTNSWSMKSQKQNTVQDIISDELFPQIGGVEMNYEKACFLAHMTRKVLWTSTQRIPTDDRDAYPNKRVDIPGFLLADLFRKTYNNRMVKDMKGALSKEIHGGSWKATGNWTEIVNINNINKIIKSTILDVCLKSSLATGKFGSGKIGGPSKDGVSQVLNRLNITSAISHLRRISTPIEKTGKLIAPRKQHNSQFGYICVKGDTAILDGNGMTSRHIIKLKDGDIVRTVDSKTLEESPSAIHHYFKTTPELILEITTLSGRTIGCSPDHPLLVVRESNEWVHAGNLVVGDKVIVKNYTMPLPEDDGTEETEMDEKKKQILARLIGASLSTIKCLEKVDAEAIASDIEELGLSKPIIYYFKPYYNLDFPQFSSKYYILFSDDIPSWIRNGSSSVKREFLSAFMSVGDSKLSPEAIKMFNELGIEVTDNFQNEFKYYSIIGYRYCARKVRESALSIEYAMYRQLTNNTLSFIEFSKMTTQIDDKIIMPITQIKEVAVEDVYDFTTESENHDFYANGVLVRNCPCETPEGHGVGVIKNMATTTGISIFSSPVTVYAFIQNLNKLVSLRDATIQQKHDHTRVFLNGSWIGMLLNDDACEVMDTLRKAKRSGKLHIHTGIIWKNFFKELWITTEAGRVLRPVYYAGSIREIAANPALKQQILDIKEWNKLLIWETPQENHLFEYLDSGETECSYIAMDYESCIKDSSYTHCEIHPSVIFGTAASGIPFPDHNQSPRNAYQCLSVEEKVRMSDGTDKCIADVCIGDEVISFDPKTHDTSIVKVCNQYIRDTDKPMFKLHISGNRTVTATEDHRFMTCHGPLRVDEIDITKHMIGIYTSPLPVSIAVERYLILDEEIVRTMATNAGIHLSMINLHIQSLKICNLLPLYSDNKSVPILARIAGFASTDGCLNIQINVEFGTKSAAYAFENDIDRLRLPVVGINKISDKKWIVKHNGPLPIILIALGINTSSNPIPNWIMNGSLMTKREFLAGFQGRNGDSFYAKIEHNVRFEYGELSNHTLYTKQHVQLFGDLGIKTYIEEYGNKIRFNLNANNLLEFYDKIGFRYDDHKISISAIIAEFIRESGPISSVATWVEWLEKIRSIGSTVFLPIKSIVPSTSSKIADITVYNDNHTFVTSHSIESMNCSMGKQAMGVYALNFRERFDAMSHVLCYPEIPMVSPYMSKFYGAQSLPSGQNIVVAIMTYTGYNQEDSNMINRGALDRGRFRSIFYRTYKDEERKNQSSGEEEKFCNPDTIETKHIKNANYGKIAEDGFVPKDTYVTPDDILIGKVVPLRVPTGAILPAGSKKQRDVSKMPRNNESGYVDKVYKNRNGEGYSFAKIRMRQDRIPEIGDKFSCYSPDTDILTMRGWIPFPELRSDDRVATLVNETTMAYTKPLEIVSYNYKGPMYKVDSNQVDLLVTPNHRMYVGNRNGVKFGFELAEDCYGKRWTYKKNIENYIPSRSAELSYVHNGEEMKEPQAFILRGEPDDLIININDWLLLFGIWIAEGCISGGSVRYAAHKERVRNELDRIAISSNIKFGLCKDSKDDIDCNSYRIYGKIYVKYFEPLSLGAVHKYLPEWVWSLTPAQCRVLIHGMMLGDGHTMANGTRRYDTSSVQLANDFQRLCLHAGYSTNISLKYAAGHEATVKKAGREGEVIRSTADAFRLTIIEKQNTPLVNKNITSSGENRHDSWEPYEGKVYCCKVEGPGAIYVRRNKMPVWSGNSRHGQKGTMGMILNQEDMPQTASGIVPDIIINPHAIPSRMTIAQLMETLLSKIGCMTGCLGDGSPFNATTVDDLSTILRDTYGMEPYGNEIMYNGYTGRMMETSIFIGPCYYQRLRHCSADKLHSRASGPLVMLTRQPAEGRAREGGLRFGELLPKCDLKVMLVLYRRATLSNSGNISYGDLRSPLPPSFRFKIHNFKFKIRGLGGGLRLPYV